MPTNSYGPNDNYNLDTCHFFPAIIKSISSKFKQKSINLLELVKLEELIFVDDIADESFFMNKKLNLH